MINNNFRINYTLSFKEKFALPIYSVYADRHFEKSLKSRTWQSRVVHAFIGTVEALPIIGMLASIVERQLYFYSLYHQPKFEASLSGLPKELKVIILSYIDPRLSNRVCKEWGELSEDVSKFQLIEIKKVLGDEKIQKIFQSSRLDPKTSSVTKMMQAIFDDQAERWKSCENYFGILKGLPTKQEVELILKEYPICNLERFLKIESLIDRYQSINDSQSREGKILMGLLSLGITFQKYDIHKYNHNPSKIEVLISKVTAKDVIKGIRVISLVALTGFAGLRALRFVL